MKVICRLLFCVVSPVSPRQVLPIPLIAVAPLAEQSDRRPTIHQLVTRSTRAWTGAENVPAPDRHLPVGCEGSDGPTHTDRFQQMGRRGDISPLCTRDGIHRVYFTLSEAVGEITDTATFPPTGIINAEIRLADCTGDNLLEEIFHSEGSKVCLSGQERMLSEPEEHTHTNVFLINGFIDHNGFCTPEIGGFLFNVNKTEYFVMFFALWNERRDPTAVPQRIT